MTIVARAPAAASSSETKGRLRADVTKPFFLEETFEEWRDLLEIQSMSMDVPTSSPTKPPTPSPEPSLRPSTFEPSPRPSPQPTPMPLMCNPTTGLCITTFSELQSVASSVQSGDVIALCGGTITTESAIVIQQSNIKLCCDTTATETCILRSSGRDRNLVVAGDSFSLQDVHFFDGKPLQGGVVLPIDGNAAGGNLVIDGNGNHTIINSSFYNGNADGFGYGGNVFVKTANSVLIQKSLFVNGIASYGGGAAIWNAVEFTCRECEFWNNTNAGVFSGNLDLELRDPGQAIVYEKSTFSRNTGDYGGGFLASGLGSMPKLSVLKCDFDGNVATIDGGAGAVFPDMDILDFRLVGNTGGNNVAEEDDCDDFSFYLGLEAQCFALSEDFL